MVSILRRLVVEDVEATIQWLKATAAERRARGVACESYFTVPEQPHVLIIAYDGADLDQLQAAIHSH